VHLGGHDDRRAMDMDMYGAAIAPRRCTIRMYIESIGIPAMRSVVMAEEKRRRRYAKWTSNRDQGLRAEAPLLELCGERVSDG